MHNKIKKMYRKCNILKIQPTRENKLVSGPAKNCKEYIKIKMLLV